MRFPYGIANFQAIVEEGYLYIEEFIVRYQDRIRHPIKPHPTDALRSFQSLLAAVSQTPHRLYLLVDEYDNFANESLLMHLLTATLSAALASYALLSCSQQNAALDVAPELGQACFEMHRSALPVGTQYEGIEGADANSIKIRIMDGTGVTTVECGLNSDGTLRIAGE